MFTIDKLLIVNNSYLLLIEMPTINKTIYRWLMIIIYR